MNNTLVNHLYILSVNEESMEEAIERFDGSSTGEALKCVLHAQKQIRALLVNSEHPEPIDMLLYCPKCGVQHVDKPEVKSGRLISSGPFAGRAVAPEVTWENPPHRSHLCHACGTIWRPADLPTNGVAAIQTRGKADTWDGKPAPRGEVTDEDEIEKLRAEVKRLNAIINSPQSGDFLRAVSTEAEHQRQRWGSSHDAGKAPSDWFWLVGYLAGKALQAHVAGNIEKAEHHIITTAAALENWHGQMFGRNDMRPGIAAARAGDAS
ncbi:hypothetical protein [Burkholderia cenocepacia]|uniref:hypothetical protein n=1 Tax=Burkholderia cenocepacia TaxID=95486 RepID=UPI0018D7BAB9|nr:hypothetical protein [Burkholderia cenocepacia]